MSYEREVKLCKRIKFIRILMEAYEERLTKYEDDDYNRTNVSISEIKRLGTEIRKISKDIEKLTYSYLTDEEIEKI